MRDRSCVGCTKQDEYGCTAVRWKQPDADEPDGPENWVRPAQMPTNIDGEEVWHCPRQTLHQNPQYWGHILKYYGMYKKGFLPDTGAISDQSNKAIEVFRALDDANDLCEAEENKRVQAQRNRQSSGRR